MWVRGGLQVPEGGKFLKGLAVIDDTAFFGVSIFSKREARGDPAADSQLAALCLRRMSLQWRKQVGPAPHCFYLMRL